MRRLLVINGTPLTIDAPEIHLLHQAGTALLDVGLSEVMWVIRAEHVELQRVPMRIRVRCKECGIIINDKSRETAIMGEEEAFWCCSVCTEMLTAITRSSWFAHCQMQAEAQLLADAIKKDILMNGSDDDAELT
jgi:hypothetical protein